MKGSLVHIRKSAVTVFLMLSALIVIGVTSIISSFELNNQHSSNTRASETCEHGYVSCGTGANYDCCNKSTEQCVARTCVPLPSLTPACVKRTCMNGMAEDYYSKSGKLYEDVGCITPIANLAQYCRTGINPSPISTVTPLSDTPAESASTAISPADTLTPSSAPAGCGSGGAWECAADQGYNQDLCPNPGLEYACCVLDTHCPGSTERYRWYGCTGQPCENTKIKNALGHLVSCPVGISTANPESCASDLIPPTEETQEEETQEEEPQEEEPQEEEPTTPIPTPPPYGAIGECIKVPCPIDNSTTYYQLLKKIAHGSQNKYYENINDCTKGKDTSTGGSFSKQIIEDAVCSSSGSPPPPSPDTSSTPPPQAILTPIPDGQLSIDDRIRRYCSQTGSCGADHYSKKIGLTSYCCPFNPNDNTSFNKYLKNNQHITPVLYTIPGNMGGYNKDDLADYVCTGEVTDSCGTSSDASCWSFWEGGQYVSCIKDESLKGFCCPNEQQKKEQEDQDNQIYFTLVNNCETDVQVELIDQSVTVYSGSSSIILFDKRDMSIENEKLKVSIKNIESNGFILDKVSLLEGDITYVIGDNSVYKNSCP